jgi:hypothetical protein
MSNGDAKKNISEYFVIGFSDVFQGRTYDYTLPAKYVPLSKLQDYLTFLVNYNIYGKFNDSFQTFMGKYFGDKIPSYVAPLICYNNLLPNHVNFAPSLHNKNSCLTMFQYAAKNGSDTSIPENFDEEKAKYNVLLSILAINDSFNNKNILKLNESLLNCQISTNIELHDQINFSLDEHGVQTFKNFYLFDFLRSNQRFHPHYQWFLMFYECLSGKHFVLKIYELINFILAGNEENFFTFRIPPNETILLRFIERFINRTGDVKHSQDYGDLKEFPIIQKSNNVYQIIFVKYYIDKLFKSSYFLLNEINDNISPQNCIPNFRTAFTSDFTEKYLCSSILKDLLGAHGLLLTDSEIKFILDQKKATKKGISESLPDFYFECGNDIFLFELKDTIISDGVKVAETTKQTIDFLVSRFNYVSEDKKKKKGIPQLVGYIEDLISKKLPYTEIDTKENVYSILLLTDDIYNVIGTNYLFNSWFQKIVKDQLYVQDVGKINIMPLCVITIDTLIINYYYFEKGIISLNQMIKNYVAECLPSYSKVENVSTISNSQIPFSSYVRNHLIASGYSSSFDKAQQYMLDKVNNDYK